MQKLRSIVQKLVSAYTVHKDRPGDHGGLWILSYRRVRKSPQKLPTVAGKGMQKAYIVQECYMTQNVSTATSLNEFWNPFSMLSAEL